jgi:hypothetical protein
MEGGRVSCMDAARARYRASAAEEQNNVGRNDHDWHKFLKVSAWTCGGT